MGKRAVPDGQPQSSLFPLDAFFRIDTYVMAHEKTRCKILPFRIDLFQRYGILWDAVRAQAPLCQGKPSFRFCPFLRIAETVYQPREITIMMHARPDTATADTALEAPP